jgi:D-alanyl-D-alanine carboxypeptidase
MDHPRHHALIAYRVAIAGMCAALTITSIGCADDDAGVEATATVATAAEPAGTVATTEPPATIEESSSTASATEPPTSPPTTVGASTSEPTDEKLAEQIEALLTDAIAPGSIAWDASGVDVPPTAAVVAVRIPGHDDVLVAVGENLDGSPPEAEAPFFVAGLTESLVRTVAFQMVDEGVLDPTLTVDQWAPTLPNADRVTVQMVLDGATGWGEGDFIEPDPILTDSGRAWSLREAVELRATVMTALAEPGTRTDDGPTNEAVLGLLVEEVGGRPLAELVRERVSVPAGLADTGLLDGGPVAPAGFRNGVFAFPDGTRAETAADDATAFLTWNQATTSAVSTPTDLLDLLDVWASGELFTTDRTAAADRFVPDVTGRTDFVAGVGIPFNGWCPCTEVTGGIEPAAIGRAPASFGSKSYLWRYSDGISVVLNVNSNEIADPFQLDAVTRAVHDLAASAG